MYKLFILLIFAGCSVINPSQQKSDVKDSIPLWSYSFEEYCELEEEYCASGEGSSLIDATRNAQVNILSIFDPKPLSYDEEMNQARQLFPWFEDLNFKVRNEFSALRSGLGNLIILRKEYSKSNITYVLAALDKKKTEEFLLQEIRNLEKKFKNLWNKKRRTDVKRLVRLILEQKYLIVSIPDHETETSFEANKLEQTLNWFSSLPEEFINVKVGQAPDWLIKKIEKRLKDSGYQLSSTNASQIITVQVDSIREPNEGESDRFTFTLKLNHANRPSKKPLIFSETVTGRTQEEALLKVKTEFEKFLDKKFSELYLD